jgi:transposase-like protein
MSSAVRAVQMLRAGRTPRELAESLGVSQQTLRNWRKSGIPDFRHYPDPRIIWTSLSEAAG